MKTIFLSVLSLLFFGTSASAADTFIYCKTPFLGTGFSISVKPLVVTTPTGPATIYTMDSVNVNGRFTWEPQLNLANPTPPSANGKCMIKGVNYGGDSAWYYKADMPSNYNSPPFSRLIVSAETVATNSSGIPLTAVRTADDYCVSPKLAKITITNHSKNAVSWKGGTELTCVNSINE